MSAIQKHLVEAFAGVSIHLGDLHARLLLGEKIDITEHATAVSTMVRIATRLGLERQAKEIGPSLGDMLRPSKGQYERGRLP